MVATQELVQKIIGQWVLKCFVIPQESLESTICQNHLEFGLVLQLDCYLLSYRYSESKDGTKSKGRKGAKNSATAAKVALMKLKLHAAGDKGLPQVLV